MKTAHRLRKSAEFERARRQGRSWAHPLLLLNAAANGTEATRCGFSVSRRIGKAVVRNRVKRRLRELLRRALPALKPGWDLVFVARTGSEACTFQELEEAVTGLLRRARLWQSETGSAGSQRESVGQHAPQRRDVEG